MELETSRLCCTTLEFLEGLPLFHYSTQNGGSLSHRERVNQRERGEIVYVWYGIME